MRERSNLSASGHQPWRRHESIQWGCVLMQMLGETTLELLPLLLSGARAPETSYQVSPHRLAIANARRLIGRLLTRRAVQKAVRDFEANASKTPYDPSFKIDVQTLAFYPEPGQAARIAAAHAALVHPLPRRQYGLRMAEATDLIVRLHEETKPVSISIRLTGVPVQPPPQHNLSRKPDPNLSACLSDLQATATLLDDIDRANRVHWRAENWLQRLQEIRLQVSTSSGLNETEWLDLRHLKHLIGLPGAGKTTLITLLCAYLASLNKRVAVFFTSIETARTYLEKLKRYQVSSALLIGRSLQTHSRHADALAELIATQGEGGFAKTRTGADLLAQNCPLPAFAVDETVAWQEWRPGEAPCENLYEPGSNTPRLCPLWSRCGRVKNQRELVTANVWLGHIRSADTSLPAHTSSERMQYFELIGETFDLVIFDEVDDTQKVLDELGALTLELSGTTDSLHIKSQRVTGLALTGNLPLRDSRLLNPHHYAANTFERHLIRFYEEVYRYDGQLNQDLENRLLTTNYLIRLAAKQISPALKSDYRSAIYAFWDSAMYSAFFNDKNAWVQVSELTHILGFGEEEAKEKWRTLVEDFSDYLHALSDDDNVEGSIEKLVEQFARLLKDPSQTKALAPLARVLIAVGFTVAAYQKLAKIARPLAHYGILKDSILESDASDALTQAVPRSLLGTFTSVRYRRHEEGSGIVMDYLVLDSTPRMLLHRLHERGTNVLLASATSWMPGSTAYHVGVFPAYILSPRHPVETKLSLHFTPIRLHGRQEALRFSGAGWTQMANLRAMAGWLAMKNGPGLSALERTARAMATNRGRHRKCALVVNSYEQVKAVVEHIAYTNPDLADKTRGVVKQMPLEPHAGKRYVLRGQVETLGHDEETLVLVFPLMALGRGVNIVFNTDDEDNGAAAVGSIYFLTRPHPVAGDLTLMLSTIAQATEVFDLQDYRLSSLQEVNRQYLATRRVLHARVMGLLARPLSASMLPDDFLLPFSANLLTPVLQMIGRAIRRSMPAEVYFVDAAWAPKSAQEQADHERTSVLVTMRNLLRSYLAESDPAQRAILEALYGPFARAFQEIRGLNADGIVPAEDENENFTYNSLEDFGDLDQE